MQVIVTVRELFDRDVWSEACEIVGISVYAVNEGLMSSNDTITLTHEQAWRLKLVTTPPPQPDQPQSFT